jgi:hypothetical protein
MKVFSTLDSKDYTVEDIYASAPMSWELQSGSSGINITSPDNLVGAVTIDRATNDTVDFYGSDFPKINQDSGVYEYILYSVFVFCKVILIFLPDSFIILTFLIIILLRISLIFFT